MILRFVVLKPLEAVIIAVVVRKWILLVTIAETQVVRIVVSFVMAGVVESALMRKTMIGAWRENFNIINLGGDIDDYVYTRMMIRRE